MIITSNKDFEPTSPTLQQQDIFEYEKLPVKNKVAKLFGLPEDSPFLNESAGAHRRQIMRRRRGGNGIGHLIGSLNNDNLDLLIQNRERIGITKPEEFKAIIKLLGDGNILKIILENIFVLDIENLSKIASFDLKEENLEFVLNQLQFSNLSELVKLEKILSSYNLELLKNNIKLLKDIDSKFSISSINDILLKIYDIDNRYLKSNWEKIKKHFESGQIINDDQKSYFIQFIYKEKLDYLDCLVNEFGYDIKLISEYMDKGEKGFFIYKLKVFGIKDENQLSKLESILDKIGFNEFEYLLNLLDKTGNDDYSKAYNIIDGILDFVNSFYNNIKDLKDKDKGKINSEYEDLFSMIGIDISNIRIDTILPYNIDEDSYYNFLLRGSKKSNNNFIIDDKIIIKAIDFLNKNDIYIVDSIYKKNMMKVFSVDNNKLHFYGEFKKSVDLERIIKYVFENFKIKAEPGPSLGKIEYNLLINFLSNNHNEETFECIKSISNVGDFDDKELYYLLFGKQKTSSNIKGNSTLDYNFIKYLYDNKELIDKSSYYELLSKVTILNGNKFINNLKIIGLGLSEFINEYGLQSDFFQLDGNVLEYLRNKLSFDIKDLLEISISMREISSENFEYCKSIIGKIQNIENCDFKKVLNYILKYIHNSNISLLSLFDDIDYFDNIYDFYSKFDDKILNQLESESGLDLSTYFDENSISSEDYFSKKMMNVSRQQRREQIKKYNEIYVNQAIEKSKVISGVLKSYKNNPEVTFNELLINGIKNPGFFSKSQKIEIINNIYKFYKRTNSVIKIINSFSDSSNDKWKNMLLEEVTGIKIDSNVDFLYEDGAMIFFVDSDDYISKVDTLSDGIKLSDSKIEAIAGAIVILKKEKNTESTRENYKVIIDHEVRHTHNDIIFASDDTFVRAKDEIVAYLKEGATREVIENYLLDEKGVYNYYYEDLNSSSYSRNWLKHRRIVSSAIKDAFKIKKIYPDDYLDILSVSSFSHWKRIIKYGENL